MAFLPKTSIQDLLAQYDQAQRVAPPVNVAALEAAAQPAAAPQPFQAILDRLQGLDLAGMDNYIAQRRAEAPKQFNLEDLLAGQMFQAPLGAGGYALPGAEGQTFAPNVPFWGGSLFKPNEGAAKFHNTLVSITGLMEALGELRRKRKTAGKTDNGGA